MKKKFKKGDVIDGYCSVRQTFHNILKVVNIGNGDLMGCTDLDGTNYYAIEIDTAKHNTVHKTKLYKALK